MIWKLFGGRKAAEPAPPARDVRDLVLGLPKAALHVMTTIPRGTSFLRGTPSIAPDPWPERKGRKLDFLAQIDLAQVWAALQIDWLPRQGALLFFYDFESFASGYDIGSQDCWAVIYQPVSSHELAPRGSPSPSDPAYTRMPVMFRTILRYPTRQRLGSIVLTDEERFALDVLAEGEFGVHPKHQVGGTPFPIQDDDMELTCELVSNGISHSNKRYRKDPRASQFEKNAASWRLLLQLDTDASVNFIWDGAGMVYFFVREADARAGDFSKVWLVLQCT